MLGPGRGQSEIVGTLFLTALVIALVTAVGMAFIGSLEESDKYTIDIEPAANESVVWLAHNGGSTVNRSDVVVHLDGSAGWTAEFRLNETTMTGDGDGAYEPGDTAVRSHGITGDWVDIMVVHEPSGTVLLRSTVDLRERTPVPGTPSVQYTPTGPTPTATPVPTPVPGEDPSAVFTYSPLSPVPGESISFDASGSSDDDGISSYEWDWTSDGIFEGTGETASHAYPAAGTYSVTLRVTDTDGNENTTTKTVSISQTWPMFQVGVHNTGNKTNTGPTATLASKWTFSAAEFQADGAVVSGGSVYVGSTDGTLYARSTADGSERWSVATGDTITASPAVENGTVYFGTAGKTLYAVSAANGSTIWTYNGVKEITMSSPTVHDGVVYIGDKSGTVHAVNADTGKKVWKANAAAGEVRSTPAVADGSVYVADKNGNLYRLDATDGSVDWSTSRGSEYLKSSPMIHNGSVIIGEKGDGKVQSFDIGTGDIHWSRSFGSEVRATPSVWNGTVTVGTKGGTLYGLDATDGSTIWTVSMDSEIKSSTPVADGIVYASNKSGDLTVLSTGTGEVLASHSLGSSDVVSAPAVADGTVFLGDKDGTFHAVEGDVDPVADFRYTPQPPAEEQITTFDASWATDPDSSIADYEWDFDDDGLFEQTGRTGIHEFDKPGTHEVTLRVTSADGGTDTRSRNVPVQETTFVDETATANLGSSPGGGAIVFADFDDDGYLDVFMNDNDYTSESVRLRENDGDLTFTDRDDRVAVEGGRGAGTGDYDNDGDPDLLVGVGQKLNENRGDFVFEDATAGSPNNEEALMFVDIDGDGDLDIWSPGEDYLWHENTDDGWQSHTSMPGDPTDRTANGEGATAADINDDGYVDFLFAEDGSDVDAWINDGDYTYSYEWDVNGAFGLPEDVDDHENMEWAWGDYDTDGDLDLYISGHDSEGLYRNDGTGSFTDVTSSAGISESDPDGAAWGDYDNDGNLDLILADSDGNSDLYNNDGDGTFTEVDSSANLDGNGDLGSTVGWFDAENDGDLDLVTNDPATLWNNTRDDAEYLRVMVRGSGNYGGSPVTPIGAQVDLYNDSGSIVGHRELIASQNQLQPPLRQHFGVDPTASYDIRVRFPSGQIVWKNDTVPNQESVDVGGTTLDQTVRIEEDGPLFADDFDRPDDNDLAYGWDETEVDANAARVADRRLDFEADNRRERPSIEHAFPEQTTGTVELSFTFNFERTGSEQWYSANIQLGDGNAMDDPATSHDSGVAVNLKWGGNEADGVSAMTDEEGFGYTLDGSDTQIGVVSGDDGDNEGGDARITVTVDLDANTYDISVTGPGLVSGSGTASNVPFDEDVDIDTLRIFLDELEQANFGDLEVDDIEIEKTP